MVILVTYVCAYVNDKEEIVVDEKSYATTVRRSDCRLICSRNSSSLQRCPSCSKYRSQLFVERSREAKKTVNRTNHDSNVPYGCLTPSEKDERMRNLEKAKRAEKQNTRLREQLQKEIGDKGVALVEKDSDDITALLSDVSPLVEKTFPKGSVQRIFWEQQAKYNFLKDSRQMLWHPPTSDSICFESEVFLNLSLLCCTRQWANIPSVRKDPQGSHALGVD